MFAIKNNFGKYFAKGYWSTNIKDKDLHKIGRKIDAKLICELLMDCNTYYNIAIDEKLTIEKIPN